MKEKLCVFLGIDRWPIIGPLVRRDLNWFLGEREGEGTKGEASERPHLCGHGRLNRKSVGGK